MKKIFKYVLLGAVILFAPIVSHALTGPFVQITTGTLQPGTANGFFVSSGTVVNLNVTGSANFGNVAPVNITSATTSSGVTRYSQNKILSVNQFTVATASSTAATNFVNTNLTLTTPTPQSSASRFRLTVSGTMTTSTANDCFFTFGRNGSNVVSNYILDIAGPPGGAIQIPLPMTFTDSPGSAVAVTYTVMFKAGAGATCTVNTGNATGVLNVDEINGL